jgi:hypothetical protein
MKKNAKAEAAFLSIAVISTAMFSIPLSIAVTFFTACFICIYLRHSLKPISLMAVVALLASACQSTATKTEETTTVTQEAIVKVDSSAPVANTPAPVAETVKKDTVQSVVKKDTIARVIPIDTVPSRPVKWPDLPEPLPGSILPNNRIIAFYGNPLSRLMGILGELPPDQMLAKLDEEIEAWKKADPTTPVMPALHVIMVTAQGAPGRDSKYRLRMTDKVAEDVISWAARRNAIVFIDIQVGHSNLQAELPRFEHLLRRPNVHLGIDAEFAMKDGAVPGKKMGVFDAADINFASSFMADLVDKHQIPPKVFIIHRFTQRMITNYNQIKLDPRVQIVMHMDGWGAPTLKKDTYRRYIVREPVQYTGFKLFYKNDIRNGSRL